MFNFLKFPLMDEHNEDGTDLNGIEIEETQDKDAQKIIDRLQGKETDEEDIELASDKKDDDEQDDKKKFAGTYETVDDLRKGINELGSTLPEYVLDGLSEEALEQHYVELRKEFSSRDRKFEKKQGEDTKDDKGDSEEEEEAKKAISPELWTDLSNEFESTGAISSEMYDKLEELGIPSQIVDNYIDGLNQKQTDFTNKVMEIAGGEDEYVKIKEWAENGGISDAELKALQTMSYDAILGSYQGIKARYDIANGQNPKRIIGNTQKTSGASYTSQADYLEDVADKRYGKNRAYTEAVERKLANSNFK